MNIIDQIIDLNTIAMMGGTGLDRFYVSQKELAQICEQSVLAENLGCKPWFAGYVDGVAIIVAEGKA